MSERPGEIALHIGRHAQQAAWRQRARHFCDRFRLDEPPTPMASFGPWVGEEHVDRLKRAAWNALEHITTISAMKAHIRDTGLRYQVKRFTHPLEKRLNPDPADLRVTLRLADEVLAPAKTDFKAMRRHLRQKQARNDRPLIGQLDLAEKRIDQILPAR